MKKVLNYKCSIFVKLSIANKFGFGILYTPIRFIYGSKKNLDKNCMMKYRIMNMPDWTNLCAYIYFLRFLQS